MWESDLLAEGVLPRSASARDAGLRTGAASPIVLGSHLLGAFAVYSTEEREPDSDVLELLGALGNQVGQFLERSRATASVADSERRLRLALEGTQTGIWEWDIETNEIHWSDTLGPLHGLPAGGRPSGYEEYIRLVHPDDREQVSDLVRRAAQHGEGYEVELRTLWPDGTMRWLSAQATVVTGHDGRPIRLAGMTRDITDRKRREEGDRFLRRASARLSASLVYDQTLKELARLAVEDPGDWCAVEIEQEGGVTTLAVARSGAESILLPPAPARLGALHRGAPQIHQPVTEQALASLIEDPTLLRSALGLSPRFALVVPVALGDTVSGAMVLLRGESARGFDREDLRVAEDLGRLGVASLENARLHQAEQEARSSAERAADRLVKLGAIAEIGLRASSLDELLHGLLETTKAMLASDRAAILLIDGENLVVRASIGLGDEVAEGVSVPVGEGIAGTIAATRTPLIVDDLEGADIVSPYLRDAGGSLAGVPLVFRERLLGVLHVSSNRTGAFESDGLELLELAAERAALAIEQTRVFERERDLAAMLQRSLLPERLPRIPGVALAAHYLPATEGARTGGDWYDAFPIGDGRVVIANGDVVGHGVEAAAAMGQIRNALRAYAVEDPSPASIFGRLNRLLGDLADRDMCTAFCGVLDPWNGTLVYANAGHPPPLALALSGDTRFLEGARSMPLGALPGAVYEETTEVLAPGSVLFTYTDGLIERRGERLDLGLARLARELSATARLALGRMPRRIGERLLEPQETRLDDVAILAIQIGAADGLRVRVPAEPSSLAIVRRAVAEFLARAGADEKQTLDMQVACGEACANVVRHAYRSGGGAIRIDGSNDGGDITIAVRDLGSWRERDASETRGGGRGLALMRTLVDDVEIRSRKPAGTEVLLRLRLRGPGE